MSAREFRVDRPRTRIQRGLSTMFAATSAPRAGRTRQIVLIVVGSLAALLAIILFAAGGVLLWAQNAKQGADGYFATGAKVLTTNSHALVSDELEFGDAAPMRSFRHGRLGTIRITAASKDQHEIFVGIGRTARVEKYLSSVAHDEVTDFELAPFSVSYAHHPGTAIPLPPAKQRFWSDTTSGAGKQTLAWPVRSGSWSVVVTNADAAAGVQAGISVGAKVPLLLWFAIGVLASGTVLCAGAVIALFLRSRGRRTRAKATPPVIDVAA